MVLSRIKIPFTVCDSNHGKTDTAILHRFNEAAVPF
jgi:hypothetical protein